MVSYFKYANSDLFVTRGKKIFIIFFFFTNKSSNRTLLEVTMQFSSSSSVFPWFLHLIFCYIAATVHFFLQHRPLVRFLPPLNSATPDHAHFWGYWTVTPAEAPSCCLFALIRRWTSWVHFYLLWQLQQESKLLFDGIKSSNKSFHIFHLSKESVSFVYSLSFSVFCISKAGVFTTTAEF